MNSSSDLMILKNLEILGLTPNQSKVIVAISKVGSADASTIALKSGVPRGKIYSILSEVVDLDLIERDKTNERIYNFRGAHHVATKLKIEKFKEQEKIKNAADESEKLLKIFEEQSSSKPTQEVWIYEGLENIVSFLEPAILNASQTIYCALNAQLMEKLHESLEEAQQKGVNVRLLIEKREIPRSLSNETQIFRDNVVFNLSNIEKGLFFISESISKDEKNSMKEFLEDLENFYFNRPNFLLVDDEFSFIVLKAIKENTDYLAIKFGNPEIVKTQKNVADWIWRLLNIFIKRKK